MKKYDSGIVNKQASLGFFEDATGKNLSLFAAQNHLHLHGPRTHMQCYHLLFAIQPHRRKPWTLPALHSTPPAVATSLPFFGNPMTTYLLAILEHKETKASAASTVLKRYYSNETKTP